MAMKYCPVCGEKYSDTYRSCPFCEEEDALREEEERGRPVGRRRGARSRQFNLITPTLIVLIIIMASLLVYLLYGDKLGEKLNEDGKDKTQNPPIADTIEPEKPEVEPPISGGTGAEDGQTGTSGEGTSGEGSGGQTTAPGVIPENPSAAAPGTTTTTNNNSNEMTYEKAMALPGGLSLNKSDFTRSVSEGDYQLKETSGAAKLTWISEDPGVASVDGTGKVTPISAGTVHIVATDGSKKAVCIVRVRGSGGASGGTAQPAAPSTGTASDGGSTGTGSGGASTLNRDDMTLSAGETFRLRLSGVTTDVTWSVGDSGVATVAGDGTVTGVSKGMTKVTASWDGQSKSCIVRVK